MALYPWLVGETPKAPWRNILGPFAAVIAPPSQARGWFVLSLDIIRWIVVDCRNPAAEDVLRPQAPP